MEEKYKKLFGYINLIEPAKGLETRILARINKEEKHLMIFKALAFGSTSLASLGFSLWAIIYLANNLKQSGFWQYLSLLFSGDGTVYYYWRELSLSIVESLPIVSLIIFLAAIGILVWSVANTIKDTKLLNLKFN
jgi:hypothetical protein